MIYRQALAADMPAATALWMDVFEDSQSFVKRCLARFVGRGNLYVALDASGALCAILSAVPCRIGADKGIYLYALATAPSHRGQGVMSGLMAWAEWHRAGRGAAFSALIPATSALFDYYRPRGYHIEAALRRLVPGDLPGAAPSAGVRFGAISAKTLEALRRKYMQGAVFGFGPARTAYLLDDLWEMGAAAAVAKGAYAIYFTGARGGLLAAELGAETDADADALLGALRKETGSTRLELTLPPAGGPYAGHGAPQPAALVKPLAPGFAPGPVYLRFGLDQLAAE